MSSTVISIVLPVFNEAAGIKNTVQVLEKFVKQWPENYELVTVDDGSSDRSVPIIRQLQHSYSNLKLVCFSRNFGQDIAIAAGLRYASGSAIVVMDADLQDPPSVIPKMIQKWQAGYQVVYGQRLSRAGEDRFKKFTSKAFYRLLSKITNIQIPVDTGDFRLMDRKVVDQMNQLNEPDQFFRGLVSWVGFKQVRVLYHRQARNAGQTKYSMHKMLKLARNGVTSFSSMPLKMISLVGVILAVLSFLALIVMLILGSIVGDLISTMTLLCGIIMISMGIVSVYLYQILDSARHRPLYIVAGTYGFHNSKY